MNPSSYTLLDEDTFQLLLGDDTGGFVVVPHEWGLRYHSRIRKPIFVDHTTVRLPVPRKTVILPAAPDVPERPVIGEIELRETWFEQWPRTLHVAFDYVTREWLLLKQEKVTRSYRLP